MSGFVVSTAFVVSGFVVSTAFVVSPDFVVPTAVVSLGFGSGGFAVSVGVARTVGAFAGLVSPVPGAVPLTAMNTAIPAAIASTALTAITRPVFDFAG